MWNPFKITNLKAIISKPICDIEPASNFEDEVKNAEYMAELTNLRSRSLVATQQITMIHERLAQSALDHIRGG